jgi:hypothetical protein
MIKIENKKTYDGDGFPVGRPTPLGNPFEIKLKVTRNMVIDQYRDWLKEKLKSNNPTSKAFEYLVSYYHKEGELTLICHCSPARCHAEVIREFILLRINGEI